MMRHSNAHRLGRASSGTRIVAVMMLILGHASAWDSCAKFQDIYTGGKELCERMWPDSFVYEEDEDRAFTMWFFGKINPNNAVAKSLGKIENPDTCELQYYHKSVNGTPGAPSPEADTFTECHPWKENACCHEAVVVTPEAINNAYEPGYRWDRCNEWVDGYKMSDACERFFVQEACFYECDPHAGQYRWFKDAEIAAFAAWSVMDGNPKGDPNGLYAANHPVYQGTFEHGGVVYNKTMFRGDGFNAPNKWQMSKMPIKASYCDAFYTACYNDYFCEEGSFWGCFSDWKLAKEERLAAEEVQALDAALSLFPADIVAEVRNITGVTASNAATFADQLMAERVKGSEDSSGDTDPLPNWAIALIVVLSVGLAAIVVFVIMLVKREKSGEPVFRTLNLGDVANVKDTQTAVKVKDIQVNTA